MSRISPQARVLLDLYPAPNFSGSSRYNFQVPIVSGLHQDDLQTRGEQTRRAATASPAISPGRARAPIRPDLFGFLDTGNVTGSMHGSVTAGGSAHARFIDDIGLSVSAG